MDLAPERCFSDTDLCRIPFYFQFLVTGKCNKLVRQERTADGWKDESVG